eukprot:10730874-Heterocapsa_arctica.AAC.1
MGRTARREGVRGSSTPCGPTHRGVDGSTHGVRASLGVKTGKRHPSLLKHTTPQLRAVGQRRAVGVKCAAARSLIQEGLEAWA